MTPQKTEPKLSAGVGGFSERCGLAGAHHREIASLVAQTVENLPPMQETWSRKFFGEEMASILAWRILWKEEQSRLQSMGSQIVG